MATSKLNSSDVMERRAINSSGILGALYDGRRDRVIENSNKTLQEQCYSRCELLKCELIIGDTNESSDLLRFMDIEDELRLSLLLSFPKREGIAAVLNYPSCKDKDIRFLYYSRIMRERQPRNLPELQKIARIYKTHTSATHIITSVNIGIDVLVVLQLPPETGTANKIDTILENIRDGLQRDEDDILKLSSDRREKLRHVVSHTVFSNIPSLTNPLTIPEILEQLVRLKRNSGLCYPLSYRLQTISSLYSAQSIKPTVFRPLTPDLIVSIEQQILRIRNMLKLAEASTRQNVPKLTSKHSSNGDDIKFSSMKGHFTAEMQRLSRLIVDARSKLTNTSKSSEGARVGNQMTSENSIAELTRSLTTMVAEQCSIIPSQKQQLNNPDAKKRNSEGNNGTSSTKRVSKKNSPQPRKNQLYKSNTKPGRSSNVHPINAAVSHDDHSQASDVTTSPPTKTYNKDNYSSSPSTTQEDIADAPTRLLLKDEIINILLLGETGVGKSTFINAFVNYLTFSSLQQAQASEPIVIIPVSFIMTTGEHFIEHDIKFGECDSANNEDFHHPGQSVTQHCKSYIFTLNRHNGKKLRIVDTPGFGDTRGLDQDDLNMQHILQYINNLSHLNAICFLLKPNASRLNMFFRTCLTQLFSLLAPTAHHNVIFCFTNARSTFYTPGDTAPLLKTMLNSLSMGDIPFRKENTFCFDSESFRYLVALQNEIEFSDEDKREYATSWSTSVKESNRLIDHIDGNLVRYDVRNGMQSMKHAEFEITHMIRPMLETMRNTLRNVILLEKKLTNEFIELSSRGVHGKPSRCLSCKYKPYKVGQFWILPTDVDETENISTTCSCPRDQHAPIDYTIEFRCDQTTSKHHRHATIEVVNLFTEASVIFARFLMRVAGHPEKDSISNGLREMIIEEKYICSSQKEVQFNKLLMDKLMALEKDYQQRMTQMKQTQEHMELKVVYEVIKNVNNYPMMHEQMVAVRQTQQIMMEEYEYEAQKI